MKFVAIEGANLSLGEGQEEYETIRVRKGITLVTYGSLAVPVPNMVAEIKPDAEDLERLNAGGSLFINILGEGWPPIGLTSYDPIINEPEGNA